MVMVVQMMDWFKFYSCYVVNPSIAEAFDDPNPNTYSLLAETDMIFYNGHFIFDNNR